MSVCQTGRRNQRSARGSRCAALIVLVLLFGTAAHAEKIEQLSPQGYVNDFAAVLDAGAKQQLTDLCTEVDQKAEAQIAVVTIPSLEGSTGLC